MDFVSGFSKKNKEEKPVSRTKPRVSVPSSHAYNWFCHMTAAHVTAFSLFGFFLWS